MIRKNPHTQSAQSLRFIVGVLVVMFVTLAPLNLLMSPPAADFQQMGLFLSVTAIVSIASGYLFYRTGWANHVTSIRWALLGGSASYPVC